MNINDIRLVDEAADIEYNMNKAMAILGDLFQDYAFVHREPTKEEIERISHDFGKIIVFINIAYDYLASSQSGMKDLRDRLEENIVGCSDVKS